jgi:hypothetical protein
MYKAFVQTYVLLQNMPNVCIYFRTREVALRYHRYAKYRLYIYFLYRLANDRPAQDCSRKFHIKL